MCMHVCSYYTMLTVSQVKGQHVASCMLLLLLYKLCDYAMAACAVRLIRYLMSETIPARIPFVIFTVATTSHADVIVKIIMHIRSLKQ